MRIRVLFWNTFLLRVLVGPLVLHQKPAVQERAAEIGRVLRGGGYDVIALAEVFDEAEREALLAAWDSPPQVALGPIGRPKSSGLVTITELPVVRTAIHRFLAAGQRARDSDTWSGKGVLLVEVDLGDGVGLEVFSTHMFFGGDLLRRRGDADRIRHEVRFAQLEELLAMVEREHREGNVALVCGDFNIAAGAPEWGSRLRERMAGAGFEDAWLAHAGAPRSDGATADLLVEGGPTQRIDYLFVRGAGKARVEKLTVETFPREPDTPEYAAIPYLSDHAALACEFSVGGR